MNDKYRCEIFQLSLYSSISWNTRSRSLFIDVHGKELFEMQTIVKFQGTGKQPNVVELKELQNARQVSNILDISIS